MTLASALRPLLDALVQPAMREKRAKRRRLIKLLSDAERHSGSGRSPATDYPASRRRRLTP